MSCISSFSKITLPGVTARLRPTSNFAASDWPNFQVAAAGLDVLRQHVHAAREILRVGAERLTYSSGLVSTKFDGDRALATCLT